MKRGKPALHETSAARRAHFDLSARPLSASLRPTRRKSYNSDMNIQELLIDEIRRQPEPVQLEVLHFLRFLVREHEDASWADVLPGRDVEQEVLSILDGQGSETR